MNHQQTGLSATGQPSRQTGLSNMLLTLLISLSLTTVALGAMYATHGAQSGEMALHAQTQAEIKAMTGVQALTGLLNTQSSGTIANIASGSIASGTQTVATYSQSPTSTTCPGGVGSSYYCFDITGSSGGASSILRARFFIQSTTTRSYTSDSHLGSVFAGGLSVGGASSLTGTNDPTVQVGGGYTGGSISGVSGVNLVVYTPTTFIQPNDVRPQANYIYLSDSSCYVNNLPATSTTSAVTSETSCSASNLSSIQSKFILPNDSTNTIQYTAPSGTTPAQWTVNLAKSSGSSYTKLPAGVLWFDGDVTVVPEDNTAVQINAIVATGSITTVGIKFKTNYFYAPSYYQTYYSASGAANDSPEHTCNNATNVLYPTQICQSGSFTSLTTWPGMVANILFLAGGDLALDGGKGVAQATTNYYGDLISSAGNGGTGNSSGKFTGNGTINITGNIVNASSNSSTNFVGNVSMTLTGATGGDVSVPVVITTTTYTCVLNSITYL